VIWGSAAVVVLGLLGAVYFYKYYGRVPPPPAEPPHVAATPSQTATEPAVRNPVPEAADTKPLPALKDSDPDVRDSLVALFGATSRVDGQLSSLSRWSRGRRRRKSLCCGRELGPHSSGGREIFGSYGGCNRPSVPRRHEFRH